MPFTILEKAHNPSYHAGIPIPEVLPLENGDCLTREEFERRYDAMPHVKKAELIEGRVYMPAAARKDYGAAHHDISQVFPGLQLDVESLLAGDMAEVLSVLQQVLQTKEHAAFVQRLSG